MASIVRVIALTNEIFKHADKKGIVHVANRPFKIELNNDEIIHVEEGFTVIPHDDGTKLVIYEGDISNDSEDDDNLGSFLLNLGKSALMSTVVPRIEVDWDDIYTIRR